MLATFSGMDIFFRFSHLWKIPSLIVARFFGKFTVLILHSLNAYSPIDSTV